MNFPTIIFFDPNQWELNSKAVDYFNFLKKAKIFHDNPDSLNGFLKNNFNSINAWWNSCKVQRAKDHFLNQYGLNNKNLAKKWSRTLKNIIQL